MVRCESKNNHQNDTCLKEIGIDIQNMLIISGGEGLISLILPHLSI